jgi:hypothetical protein
VELSMSDFLVENSGYSSPQASEIRHWYLISVEVSLIFRVENMSSGKVHRLVFPHADARFYLSKLCTPRGHPGQCWKSIQSRV